MRFRHKIEKVANPRHISFIPDVVHQKISQLTIARVFRAANGKPINLFIFLWSHKQALLTYAFIDVKICIAKRKASYRE